MTLSPRAHQLGGRTALVLAGAFAVALLASAPSDPEFGYDVDAYIGAARAVMSGESPYPHIEPGGTLTPGPFGLYPYPPVTALAFVPLALLPTDVAHLAWFGILIAVAILVGFTLVRPLPPERRDWAAAAYLAYLPLLSELRFGNLNLVTLAVCLLAWHRRDRPVIAGLLFAVAIGLKLLPLALIGFLLLAGRWRIVAWVAAAFAIVGAISWPWLGAEWIEFMGVLRAIGAGIPASGSNILPDAIGATQLRYALPLTAVAVAVLAGWAVRRDPARERLGFAVALAGAPLLATSVWFIYLVLALPALLASDGERPAPVPVRLPRPAGLGAWLTIEARLDPLPMVGLAVVLVGGLIRLFRRAGPEPPT